MRLYRRLFVKSVQAESRPGVNSDGDGLYMRVRDTGTKSWLYIGMLNRRRQEIGLGSVGDVSLAQAREKARELRHSFRAGIDPVVEKERARAAERPTLTFGEFADALLDTIEDGFRNEKHRKQWSATLQTHAAELRDQPIDQIDAAVALKVLQPIWLALPETASRVRGGIERVLDAAKAKGLRTGDLRASRKAEAKMVHMARGLERDRTVATILLSGGQVNMEEVRTMAHGDCRRANRAGSAHARTGTGP